MKSSKLPFDKFSRYEIEKELGSGNFGTAYLAKDDLLSRPIVIKVLKPEHQKDEGYRERFQVEAKALAKFNSENIVRVNDFGVQDSVQFLILEYVDGQNLDEVLQKVKASNIPPAHSAALVCQIARALVELERFQVVHRDIKPQNLLLSWDGTLKLADFGLAREEDQNLTLGMQLGTSPFMSPEQTRREKTKPASDLFSLGVTFYYCLTGERPFTGSTHTDIQIQVREKIHQSPKKIRPEIDYRLVEIVDILLNKDPSRRKTATWLKAKLDAYLLDQGITDPKLPAQSLLVRYLAETEVQNTQATQATQAAGSHEVGRGSRESGRASDGKASGGYAASPSGRTGGSRGSRLGSGKVAMPAPTIVNEDSESGFRRKPLLFLFSLMLVAVVAAFVWWLWLWPGPPPQPPEPAKVERPSDPPGMEMPTAAEEPPGRAPDSGAVAGNVFPLPYGPVKPVSSADSAPVVPPPQPEKTVSENVVGEKAASAATEAAPAPKRVRKTPPEIQKVPEPSAGETTRLWIFFPPPKKRAAITEIGTSLSETAPMESFVTSSGKHTYRVEWTNRRGDVTKIRDTTVYVKPGKDTIKLNNPFSEAD